MNSGSSLLRPDAAVVLPLGALWPHHGRQRQRLHRVGDTSGIRTTVRAVRGSGRIFAAHGSGRIEKSDGGTRNPAVRGARPKTVRLTVVHVLSRIKRRLLR